MSTSTSLTNRAALHSAGNLLDTTKWILHLVEDEQHEEFFGNTGSVLGTIEREYDANGKLLEQTTFGSPPSTPITSAAMSRPSRRARGNIRHYSNYKRGFLAWSNCPNR